MAQCVSLLGGWSVHSTIGTQILETHHTGIIFVTELLYNFPIKQQLLTRLSVWLEGDNDVSALYNMLNTLITAMVT